MYEMLSFSKKSSSMLIALALSLLLFESIPLSEPIVDRELAYDYYRSTCPKAEQIIRETMAHMIRNDTRVAAQLLRLLFHDCFIQGCDASILLDDSRGSKNYKIERDAAPNQTLRGFEKIDAIKRALEDECPGVVSCADIIVLAARDGIVLIGGPYYPLLTGRKDSLRSYHDQAEIDIPSPDDNITRILSLFSARGFTEREVVSLLGAHNIGKIDCDFLQARLYNFEGTRQPDPSIPPDFLFEMRSRCQLSHDTNESLRPVVQVRRLKPSQGHMLVPSILEGSEFDSHYYERLVRGRGLLYADQQLMAHPSTAGLVRVLASDGGATFRREFGRAMIKMSSLKGFTNSDGEVRRSCSVPNFVLRA